MSKVDVYVLAEKAGVSIFGDAHVDCHGQDLALFASLVLEEAAKECEKVRDACEGHQGWIRSDDCARSIRAMKP